MSNARNLARLLPNTSGQLPDAAMSSGSVLQVVQGYATTQLLTTSNSFVDTNSYATITPSSANSKILLLVTNQYQIYGGSDNGGGYRIQRNGTTIWDGFNTQAYNYASAGGTIYSSATMTMNYLDSPSTTAALTYRLQAIARLGSTFVAGYNNSPQVFTLMEIAA